MPPLPGRLPAPGAVLRGLGGAVGAISAAYLVYSWWAERQRREGVQIGVIAGGVGMNLWQWSPADCTRIGNRVQFNGPIKTSGALGFGELGWSDPASATIPLANSTNVANWMPAGTKAFSADKYSVVVVEAKEPRPAGLTAKYITVDRGDPALIGALNAQRIATFRMEAHATFTPPEPVYAPGQGPLPIQWAFPQGYMGFGYADFPLAQPIGAPAFGPAPRPISNAPPRPDPWSPEFPDVGPRPNPRPRPQPQPEPWNDPTATPDFPFGQPTASIGAWESSPNAPPRPVAAAGPKPPGPGTKERKGGLPAWAIPLWKSFGAPTEFNDHVSAVYEALPKSVKVAAYRKNGRQPTAQEKLRLVYANMHRLDVGKAVSNLVENHFEDKFYGKLGKMLGQASNAAGRPLGWATGPVF